MATYKKICKHCGKEFVAAQKNKIYCSDKCRKAAFDERRDDKRKKHKREMLAYTRPGPERRAPYKNDIPATDPRRRLVKLRANGLLTTEYWNLYAEVDRIYNGGTGIVNGISVNDPDFAEKVLALIYVNQKINCWSERDPKK